MAIDVDINGNKNISLETFIRDCDVQSCRIIIKHHGVSTEKTHSRAVDISWGLQRKK